VLAPVVRVSSSVTQPDPAWTARTAQATGIPVPAVRAYGRAQIVLGREQPGCHLGWTTLAGIGWVESQHGTTGDRTLTDGGLSSRVVRGPVLDGTSYAAVAQGPSWARALGPMQFLPGTWVAWGTDGDGDGRRDVDDVDDAALAAARYLCADGHDLAAAGGWDAGVLSYNHSSSYVLSVYRAAEAYQPGRPG
jgi:membrane-bound lytic murein transglycosylase B